MSKHARDGRERRVLFGFAAFLAWPSLVQIPFSAPIYFCYVTPLAVLAAVAVAGHNAVLLRRVIGVAAAVLLTFALAGMNRGYVYNLGGFHRVFAFDTPLDLERASLRVNRADAVTYRRVVELISIHIGDGQLVAGPDCPEVYFLTGRSALSGTLFEFFTETVSDEGGLNDMPGLPARQRGGAEPRPQCSLRGRRRILLPRVRRLFPNSEGVGTFEVRWR